LGDELLWWRLDAGDYASDGSALDRSGNGYDATIADAVTRHQEALDGHLVFEDGSAVTQRSDGPLMGWGNGSFSAAFWLRGAIPTQDWSTLLIKRTTCGDSSWPLHIGMTMKDHNGEPGAGGNLWATNRAQNDVFTTKKVADGTWHHIAYVLDATAPSANFYVDGMLDATKPATVGDFSNGQPLVVGKDIAGGSCRPTPFHGDLDDVRLYSRALGPLDAMVLYATGLPTHAD
jgi:hypothetical protein